MFFCIVQNRKRAAAARKSEQAGQAKTIYFAPQVDRTTKDTRQGRSAAQERGQRLSNVVGSTPGAKPVNRQNLPSPYHSPPPVPGAVAGVLERSGKIPVSALPRFLK